MTVLILVDARKLVRWQAELILCLHRHHSFNICLLNLAQANDWPGDQVGYTKQLFRGVLSRFLDFKRPERDAFEPVDFYGINNGDLVIEEVGWDSNRITGCDLVINLSSLVDEKKCADSLGISVWGLRFGRGADIDSPLASAYEILASKPLTTLRILESVPGGENYRTVYESASMTMNYSTRMNAGQLAWKVVECVPRLVDNLESGTSRAVLRRSDNSTSVGDFSSFLQQNGDNFILPATFPRWLWARFSKKARKKFFVEQWVLLTGQQSSALMPSSLTAILPPVDRIWADPFGIQRKGRVFVFFEDMLLSTWRGRISCAELNEDGSLGEVIPVLQRNYHLSYPFLIEEGDELFMIPETGENRTVELYRCCSFPDKWEHVGNLMNDIEAYDTTILKHNGHWWLFTLVAPVEGMSSYDQLHLYYSKEFPSNTWIPHPANPIVDDAHLARPAGNLFIHGDRLIRPSQDSSRRYGRGLNFNEVIEISTDTYKEVLLEKHLAGETSSRLRAMHTINHCGNISFLDAQVLRRKTKSNVTSSVVRPL